jgi:hypothetical protein
MTIHGTSKMTKSKNSCSSNDWYSPTNSSGAAPLVLAIAELDLGLRYVKWVVSTDRVLFDDFGSGCVWAR